MAQIVGFRPLLLVTFCTLLVATAPGQTNPGLKLTVTKDYYVRIDNLTTKQSLTLRVNTPGNSIVLEQGRYRICWKYPGDVAPARAREVLIREKLVEVSLEDPGLSLGQRLRDLEAELPRSSPWKTSATEAKERNQATAWVLAGLGVLSAGWTVKEYVDGMEQYRAYQGHLYSNTIGDSREATRNVSNRVVMAASGAALALSAGAILAFVLPDPSKAQAEVSEKLSRYRRLLATYQALPPYLQIEEGNP